jgi:hypothetical protein
MAVAGQGSAAKAPTWRRSVDNKTERSKNLATYGSCLPGTTNSGQGTNKSLSSHGKLDSLCKLRDPNWEGEELTSTRALLAVYLTNLHGRL